MVGDIQIGKRDAADLPELAEARLTAYGDGLAAEGVETPQDVLRRCHAVSLMLFNGLPSLPLEHLPEEPTAALHDWALQRSRIARYALDVLERTESRS